MESSPECVLRAAMQHEESHGLDPASWLAPARDLTRYYLAHGRLAEVRALVSRIVRAAPGVRRHGREILIDLVGFLESSGRRPEAARLARALRSSSRRATCTGPRPITGTHSATGSRGSGIGWIEERSIPVSSVGA